MQGYKEKYIKSKNSNKNLKLHLKEVNFKKFC